jgi:hypothetical protein
MSEQERKLFELRKKQRRAREAALLAARRLRPRTRIAPTTLAIMQRDEIAKRKRDDGEHLPEEELDRVYGDGEALKERRRAGGLNALTNGLARRGDLNKLRWVHMHGYARFSWYACRNAAEGGHLHVLEWLHSVNCPWTANTCEKAAKGGHLEVLKFAVANGCECGDVLEIAFRSNRFDIFQWACENGCKPLAGAIDAAVYAGRLDIVKILHELGCKWGQNAIDCWTAACMGNLEILKWLHEHGCPWKSDTGDCANRFKHWDCLKYAIENECPGHEEYADKLPPEYRA